MKPWAFVAHKDGYWIGSCAASLSAKDLGEFMAGFISEGCTVTPFENRGDYNLFIDNLKPYSQSPEYKAKAAARKAAPADEELPF